MPELNIATIEKQNEILSNFPISGGTDWSKYTRLNGYLQAFINSIAYTYQDALVINGKGFLSRLAIKQWHSRSARYKIFIDGVLMVNGTYNDVSGIFMEGDILPVSSSSHVGVRSPRRFATASFANIGIGIVSPVFPLIMETSILSVVLPYPLFFNESVRVQIYQDNTSTESDIEYTGGVL